MFLFDVTVEVSHEESFDLEREEDEEEDAREGAERLAKMMVKEDLANGRIHPDAFDIDVELEEVSE